jgi:DNA-binding NtrC family response regulator
MPGDGVEEPTRVPELDTGGTPQGTTPPGERRLVLVVLAGTGLREVELGHKERYEVGRSRSADVFIDDPSVSRTHAAIIARRDRVIVIDLGSTNGTWVNDRPALAEGTEARPGEVIRFGHVSAHLHSVRVRQQAGRAVLAEEFDRRIGDEEERCLRSGRAIALVAMELPTRRGGTLDALRSAVAHCLRPSDLLTLRGTGRIDALLVDCGSRQNAVAVADRIRATLAERDVHARLGVALFPGDAAAAENLSLAAEVALRAAPEHKVGVAGAAVRTLTIGAHQVLISSPEMLRVFGLVERLAAAPLSVLITGETGCGKELIAEALHHLGPRATGPIVKINCAAIPATLLESELFGHEKGAFSGATTAKPGVFETAHGGTLFLDEIAEMAPDLQAKLLRVLEDHRFRRVGAVADRTADVRVIAATHQDLQVASEQGRFRLDLYYRLTAAVIAVPPLRDRPSEILPLAERFAADMAVAMGRQAPAIAAAAAEALLRHPWPGNVRELRNAMGRAVALCEGEELRVEHLALSARKSQAPAPADPLPAVPAAVASARPAEPRVSHQDRERAAIIAALEECGGNQTKAAARLGMPRRTLVYKLTSLGIREPRKR